MLQALVGTNGRHFSFKNPLTVCPWLSVLAGSRQETLVYRAVAVSHFHEEVVVERMCQVGKLGFDMHDPERARMLRHDILEGIMRQNSNHAETKSSTEPALQVLPLTPAMSARP